MNTLVFDGAGWEGAESSIKSGVGNCRIRTRLRNNDGRVIYLEMGGMLKQDPYHHNGYRSVGRVDHCFYADSKWDSNRGYSESLREVEDWRNFEYSKESILKFVNENLNCSFESMEVINDSSVRVHDTTEPLCDSSDGDSEQYKDVEVNIRVLEEVRPAQEFPRSRMAQYQISYDYVKQHNSINRWISERQQKEQEQFPNFNYFVTLRWDERGIITSANITARQNFCTMGIGVESLLSVIDNVLQMNQAEQKRVQSA